MRKPRIIGETPGFVALTNPDCAQTAFRERVRLAAESILFL